MDKRALTGFKKRQQIISARKTMFMWVMLASAAVAVCLVLSQLLVKQMIFNNRIIATSG